MKAVCIFPFNILGGALQAAGAVMLVGGVSLIANFQPPPALSIGKSTLTAR